jgi:hypothetical protein
MKKSKGKGKIFRTMKEIEKEFFPDAYKLKMQKRTPGDYALGVRMAKETIAKLRNELTEAIGSL